MAQQQQIQPRKLFSHGTLLLTTAYIHMKVVPAVHGKYLLNPTHIDTIFPKLWTRASPHCQHFRVNSNFSPILLSKKINMYYIFNSQQQ